MDICPPAVVTAASFVAVIFLDLYRREYRSVPGHALFGVFAVLLMIFICQRGSATVAWILFSVPFLFVFLAYIVRFMSEGKEEPESPTEFVCPCCRILPCNCRRPCTQPQTQPQPQPQPNPTPKCRPKHKPCNESSYFELWLTTK